jgi:tetratricopeptide (TPR) repeat protein
MKRRTLFLAALASIPALAATPGTGPTIDHSSEFAVAAPGFYIQLGDLLTAQHRFAAARMRYETAANHDRSDGTLPVEAVRRIANTYYFEGDYAKASKKLVELAAEAEELGEWEAQLWALADAAWLADLAGDDAGFESHLSQLERLLDRHDIPGARYKVRTMLLKNFTAFSPHLESW